MSGSTPEAYQKTTAKTALASPHYWLQQLWKPELNTIQGRVCRRVQLTDETDAQKPDDKL
jgi:hypothetical protein